MRRLLIAAALATPFLTAQQPKKQKGFDADQWNTAVGLGGMAGGMYGKRRFTVKGPNHAAMLAALTWLKNNQAADGSWPSGTTEDATVAATGAALLAMLGNGSTMRMGPFKDPIKKAVNWLRRRQKESGAFCDATGPHLIASLALAESYTLSNYKLIKKNSKRALDFALSRRTQDGGWRTSDDATDSNPALTLWGATLIGTAAYDKLYEAPNPNTGILEWLTGPRANIVPDDGILGAKPPLARIGELAFDQGAANALTLCWIKLDEDSGHPAALIAKAKKRRDAALIRARKQPRKWTKDPKHKLSIHEWFASAHAFHLSGDKKALSKIHEALAAAQITEGEHQGTWEPIGVWGAAGGRAWTTAMATMTLGAEYRYMKITGR